MALFITDDPDFTRTLFPSGPALSFPPRTDPDPGLRSLTDCFFVAVPQGLRIPTDDPLWSYFLVSDTAAGSQYERLIGLARGGVELPHGVACIARTGSGFQGFHGRSWRGEPGNVHLAVHLAPGRPIERFETVFLALAAVSVVEAIDVVPGLAGRARIKWVNDVLLGGAKVAGVLAHTQTRGATVTSVVLGIGVNVETTPEVAPTPFVPTAGSLRDYTAEPAAVRLPVVLRALLDSLARNYRLLLEEGYAPLVERYRARSAVLGEEVLLSTDEPDEQPRIFAAGRVEAIGEGLELYLARRAQPITRGRLILPSPASPPLAAAPYGRQEPAAPQPS